MCAVREEIVRTTLSTVNFLSFLKNAYVIEFLRNYEYTYLENIRNDLRTVEIRFLTNLLITKEISEHLFYMDDNFAKRNGKMRKKK